MKNTILKLLTPLLLLASLQVYAQKPDARFRFTGQCQLGVTSFQDLSSTPIGTLDRYKWQFDPLDVADTSNLAEPDHIFINTGNVIVTLIVFNSVGESDTSSQIIEINPKPNASIDADIPCSPGVVTLNETSTVSVGFINSIGWLVNGLTLNSSPFLFSPPATGTYNAKLTVSTDKGCRDTATIEINYADAPTLTFGPPSPIEICKGDTAFVLVTGANNYMWDDDLTASLKEFTAEGWYYVEGINSSECKVLDSIYVREIDLPIANAGDDITIKRGEFAELLASGGSAYLWSPTSGLEDSSSAYTKASPKETTTYLVRVTNSNGCSSYDTVVVNVDQDISIDVPNFITPNNDGFNDVWNLSSIVDIETANISIFNRWGWEVFKTDNYDNNWDGTIDGSPLADGTYVYVIDFGDEDREPLRGTIEILRNVQR